MELGDLKLKDLEKLECFFNTEKCEDTAFEVDKSYLIRTVTFYYTGRLKRITSRELVLEQAAWIPDTGRFSECLTDGKFNEVEPFQNDVIIPKDSIIDGTMWPHKLPRSVK